VTTGRSVWAAAAALFAAALAAGACGKPSDEALIRGLLSDTVDRAEKRDMSGLNAFFASEYEDFEGRDTAGTLRLVESHLGRYRGVVIHLLGVRVDAGSADGRASVECEVALSHGAAEALRKLIRFAGEYYRFRIDLRKTGPAEWRYTRAEWSPVGLTEVFPESLAILKELFSGF